jgi:hypothetical protein
LDLRQEGDAARRRDGDVDLDSETVLVNRTKDEIKNALEFDENRYRDETYRNSLSGYYGPGGAGYREY